MENTTDLIEKAREFAAKTHEQQMYGDKPYMYHLEQCLRIFGSVINHRDLLSAQRKLVDEIGAAIYLHDTMEDQGVHFAILEDRFGKDVAEAVWCVTKEKPYNPDEYFKKISQNPIAAIVKLCDRVCNVNNCFDKEGYVLPEHKSKLEKYIQEDKYMINIIDLDSIEIPIDRAYFSLIIKRIKERFNKAYIELCQTNQSHYNTKQSKADEDKPANSEFSIQIDVNSEGARISLSDDYSKLKDPHLLIGILERIKYEILKHHGIK